MAWSPQHFLTLMVAVLYDIYFELFHYFASLCESVLWRRSHEPGNIWARFQYPHHFSPCSPLSRNGPTWQSISCVVLSPSLTVNSSPRLLLTESQCSVLTKSLCLARWLISKASSNLWLLQLCLHSSSHVKMPAPHFSKAWFCYVKIILLKNFIVCSYGFYYGIPMQVCHIF